MKYELCGTTATSWRSKPIDEKIYETVRSAKRVCILSLGLEEKLTLLLGNFVEFETELLKMAETRAYMAKLGNGRLNGRPITPRSSARKLTNGLPSVLDQTEGILSELRNFGREG